MRHAGTERPEDVRQDRDGGAGSDRGADGGDGLGGGMSGLGRLRRVELRDIWQSEAQDFTPWLAGEDNLALLGETLGIDLELEAVEQNIGPFRADILCKDTLSDRWVLVENQLERTDHTHLGQLMTYAAGLDAVTIVWVAARVADEHRAAMDWLNEITDTEVRFFALEVELWCIGDSPAAPKFNVVSKPNDWSRNTSAAKKSVENAPLTASQQELIEYWEAFEDVLSQTTNRVRAVKPLPQNWLVHSIGKSSITLNSSINRRECWIRAELYLTGKKAQTYFDVLKTDREAIENELGETLTWYEEASQDRRVYITSHFPDVTKRETWPKQHAWLAQKLAQLHGVFSEQVRRLDSGIEDFSA